MSAGQRAIGRASGSPGRTLRSNAIASAAAVRMDAAAGLGNRALLALCCLLMVSGCGFHLRGAIAIPAGFEPVYIQSGGPVGQAIDERLQASGVAVTNTAGQAGLILRILGQWRSSRVVAVDRFGKALAYALELSVRFEAVDAAGQPLIEPQGIKLERTFDDNPDVVVLGKQLESDIIYQDLIGDVADQILMRLRAAIASRAD